MANVSSAPVEVNSDVGFQKSTSQVEHIENKTKNGGFRNIETVALVVSEPKADFKLTPIILDEVRDNEVLIEMKYSDICHTDIVLQQRLLPLWEYPAVFGHEAMIEAIGPEGTAALVGVPPPEQTIKIDALTFLLENKKLIGVIEGDSVPPEFIPKLIAMHQAGKFPIDLLCKVYPIAKFEDAIHDMHEGKVHK
jgi:Zn-dependent alcohol dehydrogenase